MVRGPVCTAPREPELIPPLLSMSWVCCCRRDNEEMEVYSEAVGNMTFGSGRKIARVVGPSASCLETGVGSWREGDSNGLGVR